MGHFNHHHHHHGRHGHGCRPAGFEGIVSFMTRRGGPGHGGPFGGRGPMGGRGGDGFRMGRSLRYNRVPHNRLLISLAHAFGHRIERFGNPNFCSGGPLGDLT